MTRSLDALTEKEKQTLRLLLAGHDAKSMARDLGLSVHTVNERLRDARRKLSVSSSREAARLLHELESQDPDSLGDRLLGDAAAPSLAAYSKPSTAGRVSRQTVWIVGVIAMMSLALAVFALSPSASPSATPVASPAKVESQAAQLARRWLEMGDAADWSGSYAATGATFRKLNTLAVWTSVSEKVRVPLGKLVSRTLISTDEVPTPPNGSTVIKFRTRFANKAEAVETVALAREEGDWKVVGVYLE